MEVSSPDRSLLLGMDAAREIVAEGARQHDATLASVARGIDDFKIGSVPAMTTGGEHGKIVLLSLIGPAAFAVIGDFIRESGVGRSRQVKGDALVTFHFDVKINVIAGNLTSVGGESKPERVTLLAERAVILDQNREISPENKFAFRERQDQFTRLSLENGRF
ncbi:hypothetical protein SDC9_156874 [bioreactor metagenome]|uniref:Uncharacterized protein n=1 Tax=bioreactor metagenome TaxID=1076179 RepID=A0A645FAV0_9ZZZZ